jgi:hypothetical protein
MKVKITQRVLDDRNVIVVDPLEMVGTVDLRKYIEAYDPEKPKESVWNGSGLGFTG